MNVSHMGVAAVDAADVASGYQVALGSELVVLGLHGFFRHMLLLEQQSCHLSCHEVDSSSLLLSARGGMQCGMFKGICLLLLISERNQS